MIVVDTSVVSYIFKSDARAAYYIARIHGRHAAISFQTLEELWYGANVDKWGDRRKSELARYLDRYEVVWPNLELVDVCARLRSECSSSGRKLQTADAWIASTAIMLGCPLVSHDRDFGGIPNLDLIQSSSA